MSTFNVFAGLLIIIVLAVFFRTIFKARVSSSNTQSQTNLRLLRDQLKELARITGLAIYPQSNMNYLKSKSKDGF